MSLPVRSCLCRRHSERFGGPLGPRQWLRLLRRSTCSKRGSVRTVFFFFQVSVVFFFYFGGRSLPQSVEFDGEGTRSKETRGGACPRSIQVHVYTTVKSNLFYPSFGMFFFQFLMRIVRVVLSLLFLSVFFFVFFRIKHSMKEHDESSVKLQSQSFVVPINARAGTCRNAEWRERA